MSSPSTQHQAPYKLVHTVTADETAVAKFAAGVNASELTGAFKVPPETRVIDLIGWFGSASNDPDGATVTIEVYGSTPDSMIRQIGAVEGTYGAATAKATIGTPTGVTASTLHGVIESWSKTEWQGDYDEGLSLTDEPAGFMFDATGFPYLVFVVTDLSSGTEPDSLWLYARGVSQ